MNNKQHCVGSFGRVGVKPGTARTNMSVEEEQAVSMPSVRLQLEKVLLRCSSALLNFSQDFAQASPNDLAANIRQVLVHPAVFFCADVLDIPVVQAELAR